MYIYIYIYIQSFNSWDEGREIMWPLTTANHDSWKRKARCKHSTFQSAKNTILRSCALMPHLIKFPPISSTSLEISKSDKGGGHGMDPNAAEMTASPASPFTLDPTQNLEPPPSPQPRRNRSVQFTMTASPKSGPHDNLPVEQHLAESSADEITPFSGRERGGQRYYDTTAVKGDGNQAREASKDKHLASRRRASRRSSRQSGEDKDNEPGGWWHDFVDKYGSVELDNKGSVARDHLALGTFPLLLLPESLGPLTDGRGIRTHLSRLAPHLFSLRLHWNCNHAAISTECYTIRSGRHEAATHECH